MNIYNYGSIVGLLLVREVVVNIENRGTIDGIQANHIGFQGDKPTINI